MSGAPPALPEPYRLRRHATLPSTNDEAKRLAHAGAAAGTLVWALAQTAGRGRRGRVWTSPPGNLYFSLVLRPQAPAARVAQLGFVAALALADAIGGLGGPALRLACKWPNDVLCNGRKIAGILLESETSGGGAVDFAILGIGVNLASSPTATEFPATSLAEERAGPIAPGLLLERFAHDFAAWSGRWQDEGFAPVRLAWLARASGLGETIRVRLEGGGLEGRFLDLDRDGALMVEAAGACRRIAAGEVFPALR